MEKSFDVRSSCDFVYSVQDVVAEEFGPLFQCVNDVVALKRYLVMIKGFMMEEMRAFGFVDGSNYERYRLHSVGVFDRIEGKLMPECREIEVLFDVDNLVNKMNERGVKDESKKAI